MLLYSFLIDRPRLNEFACRSDVIADPYYFEKGEFDQVGSGRNRAIV